MFKWFNKLKNKKGFTLIELIVVLAVLGIIALIAIPRFLQVQDEAKVDADESTAAGIAKAAELWFVQTGATTDPTIEDLSDDNYIDVFTDWQSSSFEGTPVISIDASTGIVTVSDDNGVVYP
jgi:type IV pilus assembly protein PilA